MVRIPPSPPTTDSFVLNYLAGIAGSHGATPLIFGLYSCAVSSTHLEREPETIAAPTVIVIVSAVVGVVAATAVTVVITVVAGVIFAVGVVILVVLLIARRLVLIVIFDVIDTAIALEFLAVIGLIAAGRSIVSSAIASRVASRGLINGAAV